MTLAPIVRLGGRDPMAYWNNFNLLNSTIVAPIYSGKTVDPVARPQDPGTQLRDYFVLKSGKAASEGNTSARGLSHR